MFKLASEHYLDGAAEALSTLDLPEAIKVATLEFLEKESTKKEKKGKPGNKGKNKKTRKQKRQMKSRRREKEVKRKQNIKRNPQGYTPPAPDRTRAAKPAEIGRRPIVAGKPTTATLPAVAPPKSTLQSLSQGVPSQGSGNFVASSPSSNITPKMPASAPAPKGGRRLLNALSNMSGRNKLLAGLGVAGSGLGIAGLAGAFDDDPPPAPTGLDALSDTEKAMLLAGGTTALGGLAYGANRLLGDSSPAPRKRRRATR